MAKKGSKEDFETAAKLSYSIAGMCRNLGLKPSGGNYRLMEEADIAKADREDPLVHHSQIILLHLHSTH